jgi:putative FmdB family regulatory protein
MPTYTYRREDGTMFEVRQRFLDDPLTVDPATGQKVVRVVHAAGIIFKGSGFYVNDSKNASRSSINNTAKSDTTAKAESTTTEAKPEAKDAKAETKTETKAAAAD